MRVATQLHLVRQALGWASRSLQREFEELVTVEVLIAEMFGSDCSRSQDYQRALVVNAGLLAVTRDSEDATRSGRAPVHWQSWSGRPVSLAFPERSQVLTVSVSGPLFTDDPGMIIHGAIAGVGLGLAFENQIAEYVAKQTPDLRTGRLLPAISRLLLVLPESPKPTCNIDRANQLPSTLLKFKGLSPFLRQAGANAITVRSTVERTHDVL